ncbi:hypothetical protein DIPPA_34177 [Diplonema papillatum]|nr:hypothetical protein DIPPA_34177 [Diplonema papillatum]
MARVEGPGTGSDVSAADLLTGVHCLARVFHDCFRRFLQRASFDFGRYFVSAVDSLVERRGIRYQGPTAGSSQVQEEPTAASLG